SPYLSEARRLAIPVHVSTALFVRLSGLPSVGVTGTRGKSTTAHMLHHVLTYAGKRSLLGGNVLGISTLAYLENLGHYDISVLELDSWQLQGFGEAQLSPNVAIFTTF